MLQTNQFDLKVKIPASDLPKFYIGLVIIYRNRRIKIWCFTIWYFIIY